MNAGANAMSPDHDISDSPLGRVVDHGASESERTYSLLMHLSLLAMHVTAGVPVLGPILWLIRRHDSPFLDDHGKEAVNFQISIFIYGLASIPLMYLCGLGVFTLIATYALAVVGCILGGVAARKGEFFRYPMCLRLIG